MCILQKKTRGLTGQPSNSNLNPHRAQVLLHITPWPSLQREQVSLSVPEQHFGGGGLARLGSNSNILLPDSISTTDYRCT